MKHPSIPLLALVGALLLASTALTAAAQAPPPKNGAQRDDRPAYALGQYFVGFRSEAAVSGVATLRGLGVQVTARFPRIHAAAIRANDTTVQIIARTPGVAYIERVPQRYALGLDDEQLAPALNNGLYGLVTTRVVDAHAGGVSGAGIKVGVADEGLDYYHPDIAPNYHGGVDTISFDNDPYYEAVFDEDWDWWIVETHGTHVAGTLLAANNSVGVVGAAPSVELYHARVLAASWGGTAQTVMDGVQWLVETAGCKIVNLSLGGQAPSATEEAFYQDMRSRGALIVCAAGNSYGGPLIYPAAYASNLAVGAVDANSALADFSSTGAGLDVSAPGVGVLSSVPSGWGPLEGEVLTGAGAFSAIPFSGAGVTTGTTGILVDCGLGAPGDFPAQVAGNLALIRRGDLLFVDKVTNAMNAGAVAVVMYNNVPGSFSGALDGGLTQWIPTVGVSDTAGAVLLGQTGSQATVVNWGASWDSYSGTSMAAPHVAGALALAWSANPALSNSAVEGCLIASCRDLGAAGYDTSFGFGLIDAAAATARAQSPGSPPAAPAGLTAIPGSEQIALSWNSVPGADYYTVQRAPQSGGPYQVIGQATGTSYLDPGLTSAVPYYYVVAAVNPWGTSGNSNETSATPTVVPPPAAPTSLTAKAAKRTVNLKWVQSATPGVEQNRVYRSTNGGPYTLRVTLGPATSFSDTGLTSRTTYYYRVTALKAGKESAFSNQAAARAR